MTSQLLDKAPVWLENPLEEREKVWCLESTYPGRLCVRFHHSAQKNYISVHRTEADAIGELSADNWVDSPSGVKLIEISLESVIQQCREQGPDPHFGYPCAGYVVCPDKIFVEVPR